MTVCCFNIFISFTVYLSFIFHPSHGYEVIQPASQTVNQDGSASISCEHTSDLKSTLKDVRLCSISLSGTTQLLCQKGKKDCKNITMYEENPKKYIFILLHIDAEAMKMTYECEFTLINGIQDDTKRGTPTRLIPGQKETEQNCIPDTFPPPAPPPASHLHLLIWILIGLLAVLSLYSCVITYVYIRLRVTNIDTDPDGGTYVEMRKAPLPMSSHYDIYCG